MAPNPRDTPEWALLEERVSAIYRALGYRVERDIRLHGNQIDILVSRPMPGMGTAIAAVEVKHRGRGAVPIAEVRKFVTTSHILLDRGVINSSVMVADTSFTKESKTLVANDRRIELVQMDEIVRDADLPDDRLHRWITEYEQTRVAGRFIDLRLVPRRSAGGSPLSITRLLEVVEAATTPQTMAIFADFGAGKSTALRRLKYLAGRRYLDAPGRALRPVLFELKHLGQIPDLQELLDQTLTAEFGSHRFDEAFWRELRAGRLLILLDGFDEISVQPTERQRTLQMERISPLLFSSSPAILSSRPAYFASLAEYSKTFTAAHRGHLAADNRFLDSLGHPGMTMLAKLRSSRAREAGVHVPVARATEFFDIAAIDAEQVDAYLATFADDFAALGISSPSDVRVFIGEMYDLGDLVERPILLDMVVSTVLDGGVDIYDRSGAIGPAQLYAIYTELQLISDVDKVPHRSMGLGRDGRRAFAEECALAMNGSGALELPSDRARSILVGIALSRELLSAVQAHSPDIVDGLMTDARTCSFLTLTDQGDLRFIHTSFMEYYVAARMASSLRTGSNRNELSRRVSQETLYFLGSIAARGAHGESNVVDSGLRRMLASTNSAIGAKAVKDEQIRSNLLGALFYGRLPITEVRAVGGRCGPVARREFAIRTSEFTETEIEIDVASTVSISDCKLTRVSLLGRARQVEISSCDLSELDLSLDCPSVVLEEVDGTLRVPGSHGAVNVRVSSSNVLGLDLGQACSASATASLVALPRTGSFRGSDCLLSAEFPKDDNQLELKAEHCVVAVFGDARDYADVNLNLLLDSTKSSLVFVGATVGGDVRSRLEGRGCIVASIPEDALHSERLEFEGMCASLWSDGEPLRTDQLPPSLLAKLRTLATAGSPGAPESVWGAISKLLPWLGREPLSA